jgi:hypothetical protein
MKKIIAFAALAILVSSCGNKMTLMKRHYTKGFYLHHSGQVKQQEQASSDRAEAESMPTIKTFVTGQKKERDVLASAAVSSQKQSAKQTRQSNLAKKINEVHAVSAKTIAFTLKQKTSAFKEMSSRKAGGSDTNIILLVILSIFPFICLIAMYLHDGKEVTLNFWICLLLHLTFVLWLVFALLVDFDVINLA